MSDLERAFQCFWKRCTAQEKAVGKVICKKQIARECEKYTTSHVTT